MQINDIQFSDIQLNDIQLKDIQLNDIQFNDMQFNDMQVNDSYLNPVCIDRKCGTIFVDLPCIDLDVQCEDNRSWHGRRNRGYREHAPYFFEAFLCKVPPFT